MVKHAGYFPADEHVFDVCHQWKIPIDHIYDRYRRERKEKERKEKDVYDLLLRRS